MGTDIQWNKLVGQHRIREVLGSAMKNDLVGHAYLFSGEQGCGKFAAAIEFAMALICQNRELRPCYECESCKRVTNYSHPDLHIIMPVEKGDSSSDSEEQWQHFAKLVKNRIENPYTIQQHSSVPSIPVEWIREMNHAINRGAVEGGYNIAIMDGVELMRKESANALLKTLEEPPAKTVMIALADKLNAVLPTIVSRCQSLRFAYQTPELLRTQLAQRLSKDVADPSLDCLVHTGSYGKSLALLEKSPDEIIEKALLFWQSCRRLDMDAIIEQIDTFPPPGKLYFYESFFNYLLQLIHFAFLNRYSDTGNYFKKESSYRIELPDDLSPERAEKMAGVCQQSLEALRVRGNTVLILVECAFSLMEIFDGKK